MNISDSAKIREALGTDLNEVLRRFVDSNVQTETELQFYSGIVVNNDDPDKEGRCRIRVYGVFGDDIPDDDLPWATPDFSFIGSTLGSFIVPPVDTLVKVYFDKGEIYAPRYTTKVFNTNSISSFTSDKDTDYPNTMVFFETDTGEYFSINRATNETTYRHASGTIITIQDNGDLLIDNASTDSGKVTWNVKGDYEITTQGNFKVNATQNIEMVSTQETKVTATTNLTMKGVQTVVQGSAKVAIKHPQAALWYPNILPIDPASTAPHGGVTAGLTTLTSEVPV